MGSICQFIRTNYYVLAVVSCASSRKLGPDSELGLELQTIVNWEQTCSPGVERKLNECEFKKHAHCAPFMRNFPP